MDESQKPEERDETPMVTEEQEEAGWLRHRIHRYKADHVTLQECEAYVRAGKRLPKMHGRWLLNRYTNVGYSLEASSQANKYLNDRLDEAMATIRQLRKRLAALEGEQQ